MPIREGLVPQLPEEALDRLGTRPGDEEAERVVLRCRVAELADVPGVPPPLQPPAELPHRRYGLEPHEHQREEHGAHGKAWPALP